MVTSYNGWPASKTPSSIGIDKNWEPIPGHKFPGGVKSGDVEVVLTYFVRQLHARVERIDRDAVKDEWGWFFKPSANSPDLISCHSSGTAFDYNATRHPNGVRGTWSTAQVTEVRKIQAECSGVVRWLYDAQRKPDEMHFEIKGDEKAVKKAADKIRNMAEEPFTVGQFDDIMGRLDAIELRNIELDDDIPENLEAEIDLLRVSMREIGAGLNALLKKEGLPPITISA